MIILRLYVHFSQTSHACMVHTGPTSPLSNNLLNAAVHTSLLRRKPQQRSDNNSVKELHGNFEELPFDEATVHAAPSMISIYSAVETATSRHEEKAVVCMYVICTSACMYTHGLML